MWHKCIDMRAEWSGKKNGRYRDPPVEVHLGNVSRGDGLFSFERTVTGDPMGNGSLLNRQASNASLERERKCTPPSLEVFSFIYDSAILGKDKLIIFEKKKKFSQPNYMSPGDSDTTAHYI